MQAARGTSLNEATEGDGSAATRGARVGRRVPLTVFVCVAVSLYLADRITKHLAVTHLAGQPDRQVIGDLLQLRLAFNTGAAFSTGEAYTELFTVFAMTAVVVIMWYVRNVRSPLWGLALGSLLAGVAGNLTDRMVREPGPMRGAVVDFLMLPHWPVFNLADMCINLAAALIVVQAFRGVRLDGTRIRRDA